MTSTLQEKYDTIKWMRKVFPDARVEKTFVYRGRMKTQSRDIVKLTFSSIIMNVKICIGHCVRESNFRDTLNRHLKGMVIAYLILDNSGSRYLVPFMIARGVLPNDLKTEIVATTNFREWRHIFKLRTSEAAAPVMKQLMRPLLAEFRKRVPVIFDDVGVV